MKEQHGFTTHSHKQKQKKQDTSSSTHFGNYDLVDRIDVGGMGEVYLARQRTAFGREVAVKIIRADLMHDITARKRFLREAEVNAYLKHDHILPLLEFGEEQGRLFLVTPYIKGGTLSNRLQNGPLPLNEVRQLFLALVQAVGYLHKRGVIHRDLKPSNILLDYEEDSDRVYVRLIDFGIASLLGWPADAPLTRAGHEMGTAVYMAPERLDGVAAPSNDIYSLGIILHQMLTGKRPDQTSTVKLPELLRQVVSSATAANLAQRYSSADELARAFEHAYQVLSTNRYTDLTQPLPEPTPPPLRHATASVPPHPPASTTPNEATVLSAETGVTVSQAATPATPGTPSTPPEPTVADEEQHPGSISRAATARLPHHPGSGESSAPTMTPAVAPSVPPATPPMPPTRISRPDWDAFQEVPVQETPARPEIILPPLPGKASFSNTDYDEPTAYIPPEELAVLDAPAPPARSKMASSQKLPVPPPSRRKQKKRGFPLLALITAIILIIAFALGTMAYFLFQSAITADISVRPRMETLSTVFTMTAKPGQQSIDENSSTLPASVLTSTQKSSQQGKTTGKTSCVLGIFDCKDSVSFTDVFTLSEQIRPTLHRQIDQDLQKQAQAANALTVGQVAYTNENVSSDPQVNSPGSTVTVTLSAQGNLEVVKAKDAHDLAAKLLRKSVKPNFALVDSLLQIGQPVVQSTGTDGTVRISIAAAGIETYQIPNSELTDIQNHIKGQSQQAARSIIATHPNLDPNGTSIRINFGSTIPNNINQIKIKTLNAANPPPVQLTPIPTPTTNRQ